KLSTEQRRWTVTVGPSAQTVLSGPIDDISYLIDPQEHKAVVKGYIDNPGGILRASQWVTARVDLPPPEDVVEVPIGAIVDDGRQCVVFVQSDEKNHHYTMRRVRVTQRFEKKAFVKSGLSAKEGVLSAEEKEQGLLPPQPLRAGEKVLSAGVLE